MALMDWWAFFVGYFGRHVLLFSKTKTEEGSVGNVMKDFSVHKSLACHTGVSRINPKSCAGLKHWGCRLQLFTATRTHGRHIELSRHFMSRCKHMLWRSGGTATKAA